jgi:hypothetical protein
MTSSPASVLHLHTVQRTVIAARSLLRKQCH